MSVRSVHAAVLLGALASAFPSWADDAEYLATGEKLADLLRAARTVVSVNQPLINDPDKGDKGFTGDVVIAKAEEIYEDRRGAPPLEDATGEEAQLLEAQIAAIRAVVDEHQDEINTKGVGFKAFIPAVFGRLVNEKFVDAVGEEARVRVTAPPELVRNRKARPDPWEKEVLASRVGMPDWPKGQPYTETVEVEGRPAFRMMIPEYYNESCLTCHGGPKGEMDVTGYPKEGGSAGDLAGAISIVIFK